MRRETVASLADVAHAGDLIRRALMGVALAEYLDDWQKQAAIERQLIVVGEALSRIRTGEPAVFESIPDAHKVVGLRNLLVHGYDAVDAAAIYEVAVGPVAHLSTSSARFSLPVEW